MIRIAFILTAVFLFTSEVFAQIYSEDYKKFVFQNKTKFELKTKDTNDKYGSKAILNIYKVKTGESYVYQTIEIPGTTYDADLICFGEFIVKTRKFVLITDRYSFYILNLYNNKLLGPFKPIFSGIGQDAQSGMLSGMKIILDGRFLIGYCVDSGTFLFDLTNLYKPTEVVSANNPIINDNHIYVLQQLDHKDKSFGLFVSAENWEANSKIIFTNKVINFSNYKDIMNASETEIENMIIDYSEFEYNYTMIKEIFPENDFKYIVIDNSNGKFVYLPKEIERSNKQKIKDYLENH